MTEKDWIRLIHEARGVGCSSVQFIGGEPLLHPSFLLLLRTAHAVGMDVEVFTNATLLEDDVVDVFQTLGTRVAVSFYAKDGAIHERVTSSVGSHACTKKEICLLVDHGVDVRVGVIEQGENSEVIEQTVEYVRSLGVEQVGVDHIRSVGRGNRDGSTGWKENPMVALCGQCHKSRLAVDINGDAFPCVFARDFPIGNVREGLVTVLKNDPIKTFRRTLCQFLQDNNQEPKEDCEPSGPPCSPNCHPTSCDPAERCSPQR